MMNHNMINNFNNNMMMMPNQNNMFSNGKQQILDLINQNIQTTNLIKNLVENSSFENKDKKNDEFWKDFYIKIDFFPGYSNNRINIVFCNTGGIKINMVAPLEVQMKDLLKFFHINLQIYGQYIIKKNIYKIEEYYFLYKGSIISLNEQKTISQLGMAKTVETIIFYSKNNIIG